MTTSLDASTSGAGALMLPDEPVALSAPLGRALAQRLCRDVVNGGRGCAWFHGIWQYLRVLDLITTPRDHAAFYLQALRGPIRSGQRRMLVSGSADYGMAAYVLWAFAAERAQPDLTVVDSCATPLGLCVWYAERTGAALATEVADILAYRSPRPFDIICTHSLFGHFSPSLRRELLARWHGLLVPGGRVVTVNRIRPHAPKKVRFSDGEAQEFCARVERAAEAMRGRLDLDPRQLADMARAYVAGTRAQSTQGRHLHMGYSLRSTEELTELFETGGFEVDTLAVGPVAARAMPAPAGPTMSGAAIYAQLVAVRR
jgi:SAM-dependent methyltransferase